jgi:hypothetical protein
MGAASIQQMADRVAGLMEERLGVGGKGLAAKLRKGGRLLPRHVRDEAQTLAQAAEMAQNPRLLMRIDDEKVALAYDACLRHLGTIDPWDRRKGRIVSTAASIALGLLGLAVAVVAVLMWRGYL